MASERKKDDRYHLFVQARKQFAGPSWRPSVDVYRCPHGWVVKLDVAGLRPEDVRVEIQDGHLVVSGSRRDMLVHLGYQHHSMEITYSRFERQVALPGDLVDAELSLATRDGWLLIDIRTREDRNG